MVRIAPAEGQTEVAQSSLAGVGNTAVRVLHMWLAEQRKSQLVGRKP